MKVGKHMKKTVYLIGLMSTLMLIATGCSKENQPKKQDETKVTTEVVTQDTKEEQPELTELKFGKVTKIIGNEIEIRVGKDPLEEEQTTKEEEKTTDGEVKAAASTEAKSIADIPKELDYTGEEMSLKIDSGAEIIVKGQSGNVSDLKKGDVVMIEMTEKKVVKAVVTLD